MIHNYGLSNYQNLTDNKAVHGDTLHLFCSLYSLLKAQCFIINEETHIIPMQTVLLGCMTHAEKVIFLGDHEITIAAKLSAIFHILYVPLLPFTYG